MPIRYARYLTPERLAAWRRARGWTQEAAAKWYGCSLRNWARWEGGGPIPLPVERRIAALANQPDPILGTPATREGDA